jgi:hypothetical protein
VIELFKLYADAVYIEAERRRLKTRLNEAFVKTTPDSRPMIRNLHQQEIATARLFGRDERVLEVAKKEIEMQIECVQKKRQL